MTNTTKQSFELSSGICSTSLDLDTVSTYWLFKKAKEVFDEIVIRTTDYGDDKVAVTNTGRWIYLSRAEEQIIYKEKDPEKLSRLWNRYKAMSRARTKRLAFELIQDFESRID